MAAKGVRNSAITNFIVFVGRPGLEPGTSRLKVSCSNPFELTTQCCQNVHGILLRYHTVDTRGSRYIVTPEGSVNAERDISLSSQISVMATPRLSPEIGF